MPAPYHMDLRKRALKMAEEGMRKIDICRSLRIARETLRLWLDRHSRTGSAEPFRTPGRTSWMPPDFIEAVKADPGTTQACLGRKFGVSQRTISSWLRRAGFTKKKHLWIRKEGRSGTRSLP